MNLPVLNCEGCGVCCFHMGYPAFILPESAKSKEEIDSDPRLKRLASDPRTLERMLNGIPGEPHWHRLPEDLRMELNEFVAAYEAPADGNLDGPCFWLDPETRLCKHHEFRPNVCRDFEVGSKDCLDWRKSYAERIQDVAGSGQDPTV